MTTVYLFQYILVFLSVRVFYCIRLQIKSSLDKSSVLPECTQYGLERDSNSAGAAGYNEIPAPSQSIVQTSAVVTEPENSTPYHFVF
jgi:hypothetical protein